MPTVYDHLKLEAGLISKLPGRSRIMSATLTFKYEGNLQGLIETLEATFKDPSNFRLSVSFSTESNSKPTPQEALVSKILKMPGAMLYTKDRLTELMPEIIKAVKGGQKIHAIKLVREATECGLKEAKDAVEQIIDPAVSSGTV